MKVLEVNNVDTIGKRFNGYDLQAALNAQGIETYQIVMDRFSDDPHVLSLAWPGNSLFLRNRIMEYEKEVCLSGMTYPYFWRLMEIPEFKSADVVHYHLLHNYFSAFPVLSELCRLKASVLTLHDAWFFSGHCIHSMGCDRWQHGCGDCPDLSINFPMKYDNTSTLWALKDRALKHADLDLVVASDYIMDLAQKSPITAHFQNIHKIPFGIDTSLFRSDWNKKELRSKYHIPEDSFVLLFRVDPTTYKGFSTIQKMLRAWRPSRPVTLLGVGNKTMLAEFEDRFQVVDFDWVTDDTLMAELYGACDLFLMPSTAEAFGLMAIEAMASGRPVLVCAGTALPGVTFSPECGIAIPQDDPQSMQETVERLMGHPEECAARGSKGRQLVEEHYRFDQYVNRHIALYEEILKR